jgi:hypothetical protein
VGAYAADADKRPVRDFGSRFSRRYDFVFHVITKDLLVTILK